MDQRLVPPQFPTSYTRTWPDVATQEERDNQATIEGKLGELGERGLRVKIESGVENEVDWPVVNCNSTFDPNLSIVQAGDPTVQATMPDQNWIYDVHIPPEGFNLWSQSTPPDLLPGPYAPDPFPASAYLQAPSAGVGMGNQHLPNIPTEIPKAFQSGYQFFPQAKQTLAESMDTNGKMPIFPGEGVMGTTYFPMNPEIKPDDGNSTDDVLARPHTRRSMTPLKSLEFDHTTNRWPLPPLDSTSAFFWDPIRNALREQAWREKMEDTRDWLTDLPDITEMLEPEVPLD